MLGACRRVGFVCTQKLSEAERNHILEGLPAPCRHRVVCKRLAHDLSTGDGQPLSSLGVLQPARLGIDQIASRQPVVLSGESDRRAAPSSRRTGVIAKLGWCGNRRRVSRSWRCLRLASERDEGRGAPIMHTTVLLGVGWEYVELRRIHDLSQHSFEHRPTSPWSEAWSCDSTSCGISGTHLTT